MSNSGDNCSECVLFEHSLRASGSTEGGVSNDRATGMTLDLTHLDDAGFDKLYREQIEQPLLSREGERLDGVNIFWKRLTLGLILTVIGFAILMSFGWMEIGLMAGFGGAIAAYSWAYAPLSTLSGQVKSKMLGTIAETLDCKYEATVSRRAGFDSARELGLVPGFDRSSFEDWWGGQRYKCDFGLYEAHLEQKHQSKNGTTWVTCFRGQIMCVSFPKKFLGTTVVRRDLGIFNFVNRFGTSLKRVGLESSKFERDFEVYGSDQVEARALVHPVFMERLIALEKQFSGSRIRCAFQEGDLIIAIESRNRFEPGSMFSPLADRKRVRQVVTDIAEIIRLIDSMLTSEKAPLVALGNTDIPAEAT